MLENQTITNREAVVAELESLQTQISSSSSHYVGELYEGGVIGAIYDYFGQKSALIVALVNAADYDIEFSNIQSITFSNAGSFWDGSGNSKNIVMTPGFTSGAAKVAMDFDGGGYNDWYLPSFGEFLEIKKNLFIINKVLETEGQVLDFEIISGFWTSTESSDTASKAMSIDNSFYAFVEYLAPKYNFYRVRSVRKVDL